MTKILKIDTLLTEVQLKEVASCLLSGGIIVYPTETVYGMGCIPNFPGSVERIFSIKKKSRSPVILLVKFEHLSYIVKDYERLSGIFSMLAGKAVSFVVRPAVGFPRIVLSDAGKLAVRVSPVPLVEQIISRIDSPLVSTSFNISGEPPITVIDSVDWSRFPGVDIALDAGEIEAVPSTVLDITDFPRQVVVIREGKFGLKLLRSLLGGVRVEKA